MSANVGQLAKALVAAQAEMKNPPKDAVNPHFKNRYADLPAVREAVVPVFNRHGLAVVQKLTSGQKGPCINTVLYHSSGESEDMGTVEIPAAKQDAQGYGSAITYGRRYALLAVAGVVGDDDDDGNAASRPEQKKAAPPQPQPAPAPANGTHARPKLSFVEGLHSFDIQLASEGLCRAGDLVKHIAQSGKRLGLPDDMSQWAEADVKLAREECRLWAERKRSPAPAEVLNELVALAARKGVAKEGIRAKIGAAPKGALTLAQADRAVDLFGRMPDALVEETTVI